MNLGSVTRVAAKELRFLIYSPIGWVVLAIYFVQVANRFTGTFELYFQQIALGNQPRGFALELFTSSFLGVYQVVINNVFLIIPLITMGVFARELQSGSIKLLLSSPIRPVEIVLGKFVGIAAYLLLFVVSTILLIAISAVAVPNFDVWATMPGIVGVFLLVCTYAAIGIFVSSLTNHQVVAAIVTLAILFVLQSMANWLQSVPILNEVAAWASMAGRARSFQSGLFATPDLVYFLVIIGLFLVFTALRISALRSGERLSVVSVKGAIASVTAVAIGWGLSVPQLSSYIDTTYNKRNSLSPESSALMQRLEGDWEIVTYANILDRMGRRLLPSDHIADKGVYDIYRHRNPNLRMRYQLYYDVDGAWEAQISRPEDGRSDEEFVREYADRIGLNFDRLMTGVELDSLSSPDLASEGFRTFRVLKWNGREAILRHYFDNQVLPDERQRAAAIKRLLDGAVLVGVAEGRGERSIHSVGAGDYELRFTRKNERLSLDFIGIDVADPIPSSVDVLMISDPRISYTSEAIENIRNFINGGGNAVVLLEENTTSSLDVVLADLGLARGGSVTQQSETSFPPEFLLVDTFESEMESYWNNGMDVVLDGAVSIEQTVEDVGYDVTALLRFGQSNLGYSLRRLVGEKEQRILVFGDADLFSNANAERRFPSNNTATAFDAFYWLSEGAYPVKRTRRQLIDRSTRIDGATMQALKLTLVGGFPLMIVAMGGLFLARRRAA